MSTHSKLLCAACGLLVACGLLACGRDGGLEPIVVLEPWGTLLDVEPRVLRAPPHFPPALGVIEPGVDRKVDSGILPALVLQPPSAVAYTLPSGLPEDSLLEFCAGIDRRYFDTREESTSDLLAKERATARVCMDVRVDGELAFQTSFGLAEGTPHSERVWHRGSLPVRAGSKLQLSCRLEGELSGALPLCGFGLLELGAPRSQPRAPADPRTPNLVLLVVDTLRADALGCQGGALDVSPNIDALARRGARFERAYAPSSWTWPSTASLLTGLTPFQHGLSGKRSNRLDDALWLLPEAFQQAGASTLGISANPLVGRGRNFDQGFEEFVEIADGHADELIEAAGSWLKRRRDSRFLLYLHFMDPHGPYAPESEFRERFAPDTPSDLDLTALTRSEKERSMLSTEQLERLLRDARALYAGEVAQIDAAVGRLLSILEELQLSENTLVAFTADHGEEFLEHGQMGHAAQLHEESLRVPLILAGPGVPQGIVRTQMVETRLLGSTLLGRAGLARREGLDGGDLLAATETESSDATAKIFASTELGRWPGETQERAIHAVLDGPSRLFFAPSTDQSAECIAYYDLRSDPMARHECGAEHPAEVARLRATLQAWLAREQSAVKERWAEDHSSEALLRQLGYLGD